jgi:FkbM family methyltransferase
MAHYQCRFHVDTNSFLEWSLFFYGAYEAPVLRVVEDSLRPGDTAVDVGANIGIHSAVMASCVGSSGRVLSLEPNTRVAERLRQNLVLNRLDQIEVFEVGASDSNGVATLWAPSDHDANQGTATLARHDGSPVLIRTTRLDDLAELSALALLKIDAEGWEYPILRGAEQLLGAHHPRLLFEFDPYTWAAGGWKWRDCASYLEGLGYSSLAIIGRHGMERLTGDPLRYAMVVAD